LASFIVPRPARAHPRTPSKLALLPDLLPFLFFSLVCLFPDGDVVYSPPPTPLR
jgi:hypothetical protein